MIVIDLDKERSERAWDGKLKQGPVKLFCKKRINGWQIERQNNIDIVRITQRMAIHEIAEFLFTEGFFASTETRLPIDDRMLPSAAFAAEPDREIEISIMVFVGQEKEREING